MKVTLLIAGVFFSIGIMMSFKPTEIEKIEEETFVNDFRSIEKSKQTIEQTTPTVYEVNVAFE